MEKVDTMNMESVQLLDNIVREVYSIAAGLVNNVMEVIRGYDKLATALHVWQQQIQRKCRSLHRPTSTLESIESPEGNSTTNTVSSAASSAKKKRSKCSGRKT